MNKRTVTIGRVWVAQYHGIMVSRYTDRSGQLDCLTMEERELRDRVQTLENAVRSCKETTARGFERTGVTDWEIFILPIGNGLLGKGAQGFRQ